MADLTHNFSDIAINQNTIEFKIIAVIINLSKRLNKSETEIYNNYYNDIKKCVNKYKDSNLLIDQLSTIIMENKIWNFIMVLIVELNIQI